VDDLGGVALPAAAEDALHRMTGASDAPAQQHFALEVLAGSARASGEDSVRRTRDLLLRVLGAGSDALLRDTAARLLAKVPLDDAARAALGRTAADDEAWNVRYAALATLSLAAAPNADDAITRAERDADERVRAFAAQLRAAREPR
jgi:hypothetical protein